MYIYIYSIYKKMSIYMYTFLCVYMHRKSEDPRALAKAFGKASHGFACFAQAALAPQTLTSTEATLQDVTSSVHIL